MNKTLRFHMNYGFTENDLKLLDEFTNRLSLMKWTYSGHCLGRLFKRASLGFIETPNFKTYLKLESDKIFEFYKKDDKIMKACYRIPHNDRKRDLILVVTDEKMLVTMYFNKRGEVPKIVNTSVYYNRRIR